MRKLKLFLLAVLILLAFLSLITLFLPSKVTVSKSITINAAKNIVVGQLDNFYSWKNWYPAFQNKKIAIAIQDSSLVILTDKRQHILSMKIVKKDREKIVVLLLAKNRNTVTYQFILSATGKDETLVIWNVNTKLAWYPWEKLTGIFLDKITGPQYEASLEKLKKEIEEKDYKDTTE